MRRNVLNSPRLSELKKRRRKVLQNKILLFIFALSVIFTFLAYISRVDRLNISNVEISGNKIIEEKLIKDGVEQAIKGKYLLLIFLK